MSHEQKLPLAAIIGWMIHVVVWVFMSGGAYFMLRNHEERLKNHEDKMEKKLSKEDFENWKREYRWQRRG